MFLFKIYVIFGTKTKLTEHIIIIILLKYQSYMYYIRIIKVCILNAFDWVFEKKQMFGDAFKCIFILLRGLSR